MEKEKIRLPGVKRAFLDRFFWGRLACLIFLVPGSAYSATYFTAKTGSDSNPGTQSAPFLTIGKGISVLSSGDVLEVGAGVYTNDPIENVPSGTPEAYTTIRTRAAAQIRFSSYDSGNRAVYLGNGRSYIDIDGFILGGDSNSTRYTHDNVKLDGSSHHIRIQNCEVRYSYNQGILIANSSPYTGSHEILNNHVHHNGVTDRSDRSNQVHGIYLGSAQNVKIWGNDLHNNQAYDVQIWDSESSNVNNNNDIQYNKMRDSNVRGGIIIRGGNNLIANNVIWNSADTGINNHSGSGNRIYNNTVYSCTGTGIKGSGADVRNNIAYLNGTNISGDSLSNNLTSNPDFVNAAEGDFHIRTSSDAKDAGTMLTDVAFDHDRVPRPQGASHDIGAFEFTGQPAPSPAATIPQAPSSFAAL